MEEKVCPGCHFGCAIEGFQCGRGEKLCARWRETGELPERRGPGKGPGRKPDKRPLHAEGRKGPAITVDDQLMRMLHIVGIALHDLADESGANAPERRVLDCLLRHDLAASARIIEGRTHLPELDEALAAVQERGLVEPRQAGATTLHGLTDAGLAQARAWEAGRKAAEAEFLGVLADDEKEQLLALVAKLLEPGFKRRGM